MNRLRLAQILLALGGAASGAAPGLAQDSNQGNNGVFTLPPGRAAQPAGPEREGPEIDVPRDTGPAPQVVVPAPVAPAPTVTPQAVRPTRPTPTPTPTRPVPQVDRPATSAPVQRVEPEPRSTPPVEEAAPVEVAPLPRPTPPAATPPVVRQPQPVPAAPAPKSNETGDSPWLVAGLVLLAGALAAWLLLRRRRGEAPAIRPVEALPPAGPKTPAPPPRPVAPPPGLPAERPRIAVTLELRAARLTLAGCTVGYALTVRNDGAVAAEDVLVRGVLTGADATQQAVLERFLAREAGYVLHSLPTLGAGDSHWLTGELRIDAADIAPVRMGGRDVLVPLMAFDADYRWEAGAGRTAGTWVVGQEQDPPTERLSPLPLDRGMKPYRDIGCRPTALDLQR